SAPPATRRFPWYRAGAGRRREGQGRTSAAAGGIPTAVQHNKDGGGAALLNRRTILASGAALAATTLLDRGSAAWAAAGEARSLKPLLSPAPHTTAHPHPRACM